MRNVCLTIFLRNLPPDTQDLFSEIFPSRSRACVCLVCFCRDIYLFTFTHVSRGILKCGGKRVCQMCCRQSKHVTPRILSQLDPTTHFWGTAPSQQPKVPKKPPVLVDILNCTKRNIKVSFLSNMCSQLARTQINNARYKYGLYIYSLFNWHPDW